MNDIVFDLHGPENGETFVITHHLRWRKSYRPAGDGYELVLQQMWQGDRGTQKWEDVPTVSS